MTGTSFYAPGSIMRLQENQKYVDVIEVEQNSDIKICIMGVLHASYIAN